MKILLTGGKGMLGRTLRKTLTEHELYVADLPEADICDREAFLSFCLAISPDVIIHCAAMTNVDACETNMEEAFRINAAGSANVAYAARKCNARLIAISTDYVFGEPIGRAFRETDLPQPKTIYGMSKLAGERSIRNICPERSVILRIAWLYGEGGPSFLHTMLKLGSQTGAPLKVVDDQKGNPTSCESVTALCKHLIEKRAEVNGVIHASCAGETTWYGFTKEIFRIKEVTRPVVPCTTAEFPRPAPRPADSRLEKSRITQLGLPPQTDWRDALAQFLRKV